jgi:CBS domain-containing protein
VTALWPLWLGAGLVLPWIARAIGGGDGRRRRDRALAPVAHLAALCAFALLATSAGAPRPEHANWNNSGVIAVLLAGLLWTEGVQLFVRRAENGRAHGAATAEPGDADDADRGGGGSRERLDAEDPTSPGADGPDGEEGAGEAEELPAEAQALLARVRRLDQVRVEEIMTPRDGIVWVDAAEPLSGALARMRSTRHSRLPVASGSPDRIVGVVHAKDLIALEPRDASGPAPRRHVRRCLRVPQGQTLARLLEDFRRHRVHIGVITDRLGTTRGLVTVNDVFSFIAGAERRRTAPAREERERQP